MSNASESDTTPKTQIFADTETLDEALAQYVEGVLLEAVGVRGKASLVVSGGSTPRGFFKRLAQKPLPWQKIEITLADERWVPVDHPDSNEKQLRAILPEKISNRFLSLRGEGEDALAQAAFLNKRLVNHPPFDVVILGMGTDGHTASLFPDAPQFSKGLDTTNPNACLVVDPPQAPHQRISMSLGRLLRSQQVIVHLTGAQKAEVLAEAWRGNDPCLFPIAAVLHQQRTPVSIFCDHELAIADYVAVGQKVN
ncbi:6-phosphogluconolactonase [Gammaproteobacteria bacterium]|nr:6-phosphogluconolactonase [Gammaproteobacteria bacterium]